MAGPGPARRGLPRRGRHDKDGRGRARHGGDWLGRHGADRHGKDRTGKTRHARALSYDGAKQPVALWGPGTGGSIWLPRAQRY